MTSSAEPRQQTIVPLTLVASTGTASSFTRSAEPVTVGLPFPRGLARDISEVALYRSDAPVRVQGRVLDRWPDGSLRWALLDFQADAGTSDLFQYEVRIGSGPRTDGDLPSVVV